jgi:shikimate 5-dehydrogenase
VSLEFLAPGAAASDGRLSPIARSPMERAARAAGAPIVDGLGMLVHQAALQVECWTGRDAPVATMREAALQQLG